MCSKSIVENSAFLNASTHFSKAVCASSSLPSPNLSNKTSNVEFQSLLNLKCLINLLQSRGPTATQPVQERQQTQGVSLFVRIIFPFAQIQPMQGEASRLT